MRGTNTSGLMSVGGTLLIVLSLCSGCFSPSPAARRLDRYRPDERRRGDWFESIHHGYVARESADGGGAPPTTMISPVKEGTQVPQVVPPERPSAGEPVPAASSNAPVYLVRSLVRGDRLTISLLGIPDPQQIEDVIDDSGNISLPHIGEVKVVDRKTSEAEDSIRRLYIEREIYRDVNVIIVSKDDEFFVRGEVKREGRYLLTGAMTLVKAISVAGGYTEFADKNEAEIMRGDEIIKVNTKRIHDGRDRDRPINRGDIVNVRRRWIW